MIRFFYKEDPDKLTDEVFVERVKELKWLANEGFLKGITL